MPQRSLDAVFMRGGTSKALVFKRADLPAARDDWAPIFAAAMGSPDPNGRQLNGMGGGLSSLSKVCVVGPSSRPDADVDYTFGQVAIDASVVDYAGNCGNMSSAIGPFAVDEGLVPVPPGAREAQVRIHNTNTGKIIVSTFALDGAGAAVGGDLEIDGVSGRGAPIRLDFLAPGATRAKALLPTGGAVDTLAVAGDGAIEATLVDAATPCVFVRAGDVGLAGDEMPADLDGRSDLLARLERIRRAASVAMGFAADVDAAGRIGSVPKIGIVSAPGACRSLAGKGYAAGDMDLRVRMLSMGQPHRAVPLTGALCLAAACRLPGTLPNALLPPGAAAAALRIAHPSGITLVEATTRATPSGIDVESVTVFRTARRLFAGRVYW